jgi:hypothetical protein
MHSGQLLWGFYVYAVAESQCAEATYRTGFCCDATLDVIEIALDMNQYNTTYWQLVNNYWLINPDGSVLQQVREG